MDRHWEADRTASERKARLYLEHPDESPQLIEPLAYLIDPPGRLSPTQSWIRFRDETLVPMMAKRPDDPNLTSFLRQAEAVLAWRATVRAEDRFWRK
jgi:hypothetical protein